MKGRGAEKLFLACFMASVSVFLGEMQSREPGQVAFVSPSKTTRLAAGSSKQGIYIQKNLIYIWKIKLG